MNLNIRDLEKKALKILNFQNFPDLFVRFFGFSKYARSTLIGKGAKRLCSKRFPTKLQFLIHLESNMNQLTSLTSLDPLNVTLASRFHFFEQKVKKVQNFVSKTWSRPRPILKLKAT